MAGDDDDDGGHEPERVDPHRLHELVGVDLGEDGHGPDDAGVGKEDVEAAVAGQGVADHLLDGGLVGGVELARVHVYGGPGGRDVGLVGGQVGIIVVTDVDGPCPVLGELVGGSAADAQDRVGALFTWSAWGLVGG